MSEPLGNNEFQAHTEQIERLVRHVSALRDEDARNAALGLLQSLMDLHGAVLLRTVDLLGNSGESGRALLDKLGNDPLVCGLMVLYGVHPLALSERLNRAMERVRLELQKRGGGAELIACSGDVIRVKIQSSGSGCHSSADALKGIVEQAIREFAPEVVEIVFEGLSSSASGFVPIEMIQPVMTEEKKYEESTA